MKCKCNEEMVFVTCDDLNQQDEADFCYNLYNCGCGMILVDSIHHAKLVWLNSSTNLTLVEEK